MKKKKLVKKKKEKESEFQKAMKKKLRSKFSGLKFKNRGDGMTEISFN
tara:strand:- start:36 stop:179 length:144 start_codon:yes stop_codon:yes gene_type:complete